MVARIAHRGPDGDDLRMAGPLWTAFDHPLGLGVPEVVVDGEVIEADPPRKLVQTWRFLWDENVAAEGPTHVTYDIEEDDEGYTRLTVTPQLEGAPITAGFAWPARTAISG